MQTYKNLGGNSGISAYEIFDDYIAIQFMFKPWMSCLEGGAKE